MQYLHAYLLNIVKFVYITSSDCLTAICVVVFRSSLFFHAYALYSVTSISALIRLPDGNLRFTLAAVMTSFSVQIGQGERKLNKKDHRLMVFLFGSPCPIRTACYRTYVPASSIALPDSHSRKHTMLPRKPLRP